MGIQRRLSATRQRNKPEVWLFPGLKTKHELASAAPVALAAEDKQKWAEQRYGLDLAARLGALTVRLRPGVSLSASFADGELSFAIDCVPIIDRVFVATGEGQFIAAQWRIVAATFTITESTDGKKLADALRKLAVADNPAVVQQIIALESQLAMLDADIVRQEAEMDAVLGRLYGLTKAEKVLIKKGLEAYRRSEEVPAPQSPAPAATISDHRPRGRRPSSKRRVDRTQLGAFSS